MHNPDRQLNTVGAAENNMTIMEAFCIMCSSLCVPFDQICLLTALMEGTKTGRRIMDWLLTKLGLDDDYDDYDD